MTTTRAKFTCTTLTKTDDGYEATFAAVTSGSDENDQFFKSTPWGEIKMGTIRGGHFAEGATYYVDFTPAE